jgi:transposase
VSEAELRQQPSEVLVALVLQLQAEVAVLRAELAQRDGPGAPPKTPENSSLPPAQGWKRSLRPPPSGGKRGPKPGHLGVSRRRVEPDHVLACRPTTCGCGADLTGVVQRRVGQHQITELPPLRAVVIEAQCYAATCPSCGNTTTAPMPDGFTRGRVFGPRLTAVVTYLHQQHHVSYQRLPHLTETLFGLHLSQGAIAHHLRQTAQRLAPAAEAIKAQVRGSPVIGSDETTARMDGRTAWQWVFQTPAASYHTIQPTRGAVVLHEVLGDAVPDVWISDLYPGQLTHPAQRTQVCLAHQLRDLQYARDCGDRARPERRQAAFSEPMQALFRSAIHLAHQRDRGAVVYDSPPYQRAVATIERRCDRLLALQRVAPAGAKLQARYRKRRGSLFVFLDDPRVPPTNNASEQALRPSVIHRKVSGGFRSDWGAQAHATVATVLQTARKQGQDLFGALLQPLGPALPRFA